METQILEPINQKSFYNKAKVLHYEKSIDLLSYNTIVAKHDKESQTINIFGWYSKTTALHINSFLSLFGLPALSKKDLINGLVINLNK